MNISQSQSLHSCPNQVQTSEIEGSEIGVIIPSLEVYLLHKSAFLTDTLLNPLAQVLGYI